VLFHERGFNIYSPQHPRSHNAAGVLPWSQRPALCCDILFLKPYVGLRFGAKERSTLEVMGYFSLIGQLRVHCMLGAYHNGLSTVRNLDFQSRAPFLTRVVGAYVTTLYYSGFAHLMLRRYAAAAQALGSMLVYLSRTRQYHTRSFHYDQILKKYEQMFALLALSQTLAPHQLDDVRPPPLHLLTTKPLR